MDCSSCEARYLCSLRTEPNSFECVSTFTRYCCIKKKRTAMSAVFHRWRISTREPDRRIKMDEKEKTVRLINAVGELENSLKNLQNQPRKRVLTSVLLRKY